MPRYRLLIEYDGRPYHGFQAQAALPSVQGAIERAVKGFCGQDLRLQAAGRTDTGVHATGQVIHVDLDKAWNPETVRRTPIWSPSPSSSSRPASPRATGTPGSRPRSGATSTGSSIGWPRRRWTRGGCGT